MDLELTAVAANALLLLLLLLAQQLHHDVAQGLRWTLGNRDEPAPSRLAQRISRTVRNHLEGAAIFTPLTLALVASDMTTEATGVAAMAFVGFRTAYAVSYIAGAPYVRSGLWMGAIVCSVVVGWPLLGPLL